METYEFSEKVHFSKIHVFPYSKRDGTAASRMTEVSPKDKSDRVRKLLELSDILEDKYNRLFIGKKLDVLIEEIKDNKSIGHTSNFIRVEVDDILEKNKIYSIEYKK